MTINIIDVDTNNATQMQDTSDMLVSYLQNWATLRDPSHEHYNKVPLSDISRINNIIADSRYGRHNFTIGYDGDTPMAIAGTTKAGEIVHVYVMPEYAGQGIAKRLIDAQLRHGGWFASVHYDNIKSQKLFSSCGFIKKHRKGNLDVWLAPGVL